jgi:hypothetical protein
MNSVISEICNSVNSVLLTGLNRPNTEKEDDDDDDDDERKHAYKGIILFFGNYQIIYQYIQQDDEGF